MTSQGTTPAHDKDGWIVSSFSNGNASCVNVKFAEQGTVMVRDSKDKRDSSPVISILSDSWTALLKQFNHPA